MDLSELIDRCHRLADIVDNDIGLFNEELHEAINKLADHAMANNAGIKNGGTDGEP